MSDQSLKKRRILLVDDEPELRRMVATMLAAEGFSHVVQAANVQEALAAYRQAKPELALLDVMLPDGDGFTLCQYLRAFDPDTPLPVIFLTAKDETDDRLAGLRCGADDYVTKPFSPQELILRMQAVLRRCYPAEPETVHLENATLDLANADVLRRNTGEHLTLTVKERAILDTLARNANRIVTTDALCEAAWGDSFGYAQSLMTHVRRIREKIEKDPSQPQSLVTAKGLGYKLNVLKDR
ncbi:response regulator transcription factor [Slackia sp.]|uniref:response regulator transcription factor n=1 Tax=Slackia sp. TaxID=2049041 RepID=UPI00280A67BC|nr:response regulator transcription factor [uncultured Slackia sp.]